MSKPSRTTKAAKVALYVPEKTTHKLKRIGLSGETATVRLPVEVLTAAELAAGCDGMDSEEWIAVTIVDSARLTLESTAEDHETLRKKLAAR